VFVLQETKMSQVSSLITASEAQEILNKHNCARQRYGLKPLVWNWEVAAHAQEHADRCIWDHASKIGLGVPGEGENLSLAMNKPVGVDGWLAEEKSYNCPSGQCAASAICGHWTQMAWANTGQIGCGKRRCASLEKAPGFVNSDILVCRYTPPGNYIGQRMVTDAQCVLGSSNKTCSSTTTPPVATPVAGPTLPVATTTVSQTPVTKAPAAATPTNVDKFSAEQQRIAELRQNSTANTTPNATYTPYYPSPSTTNNQPLPNTIPVYPDSSEDGYPTAEQAIQDKSVFARNIIIAVSVTVVLMLLVIAFFTYRYRKNIAQVWQSSVQPKLAAIREQSNQFLFA